MSSGDFPPFRPHPLLRGGHMQTVIVPFVPHQSASSGAKQHHITLADGDVIVVHDDRPAGWSEGDRIAVLVHGLGGSHQSSYMVRIASRLNEAGVRTFRMDLRSAGAGEGLARLTYHAGRSADVLAALNFAVGHCPGSAAALLGFSLGGGIVLKLLGERPENLPGELDRSVAVNPPVDLSRCAESLRRPAARLYDRWFARLLCRQMSRHYELRADAPRVDPPRTPRGLFDFDDFYTAPIAGFEGAEEYYAASSAGPLLRDIGVRTLILTARDDPLVPADMFDDVLVSAAVTLHVAAGGGHLGYLGQRGSDPDRRWMDWRILDWVGMAGE